MNENKKSGIREVLEKRNKFKKILKKIKNVEIQGARNVAREALKAYYLFPGEKTKEKILSLRPTEPMMYRVLKKAEAGLPKKKILKHFNEAQEKINENTFRIINNHEIIFTHCHSTNVVNALICSKKKGKNFQVYNTETRPLYQGRKTSKELSKAGIKVTQFVDSALGVALDKRQGTKKVDKVFLGSDAITEKGIVNKIGSRLISEIARKNKIPVYIIADSWKFSDKKVYIEQRPPEEVWKKLPKHVRIKNPAFEFVPKKYITGIVSEISPSGSQSFDNFVKKSRKDIRK